MTNAATGSERLAELLAEAESEGFTTEFTAAADIAGASAATDDGLLHCETCNVSSPTTAFDRVWTRRLEGASDPADMLHVSALVCPSCGTGGVFISPFGPSASRAQTVVLHALRTADEDPPTEG